jgi:hypothetical protein
MGMTLKDYEGKKLDKSVFLLVFEDGQHSKERIEKICESFSSKTYHLPEEGQKRAMKLKIK